jgi:hypothetical protein
MIIKLKDCIEGMFYRVAGRGCRLAIFNGVAFVTDRLETIEKHDEEGGTVTPYEELELTDIDLQLYKSDGKILRVNKPLKSYFKRMEKKYPPIDILFIDDTRERNDFVPCGLHYKTGEDAIQAVEVDKRNGDNLLLRVYLDYDLGTGMNGAETLKQLIEMAPIESVVCISMNPVGTQEIYYICQDHSMPYKHLTKGSPNV